MVVNVEREDNGSPENNRGCYFFFLKMYGFVFTIMTICHKMVKIGKYIGVAKIDERKLLGVMKIYGRICKKIECRSGTLRLGY